MKRLFCFCFLLCIGTLGYAQNKLIMLSNPSFEGWPATSSGVPGWVDCQQYRSNRVDVQPNRLRGSLQVAAYGESYTGLMTREDGTTEAIGQPLSHPLEPGKYYATELVAALPIEYISRNTNPPFDNFARPVRLQLWAGQDICDRQHLLAQTTPVQHTDWQSYRIRFSVPAQCTHLIVEAYYAEAPAQPYNGAVLVDFLQHISVLNNPEDTSNVVALPPASMDTVCWTSQETNLRQGLHWLRPIREELVLKRQRVPEYGRPAKTLADSYHSGIQKVGFEPRFQLHRFYDCLEERSYQANLGFHRLGTWMYHYQDYHLVVNINQTELLKRAEAEEMILRELAAVGIPMDRVDVRFQRKPQNDRHVSWLGTVASGVYTMGVINRVP